ncbi:hypothetical protein FKM82_011709 [Ascaphus truei]
MYNRRQPMCYIILIHKTLFPLARRFFSCLWQAFSLKPIQVLLLPGPAPLHRLLQALVTRDFVLRDVESHSRLVLLLSLDPEEQGLQVPCQTVQGAPLEGGGDIVFAAELLKISYHVTLAGQRLQ